MTAQEMKQELLGMEELSWGDERLLNRPDIRDHAIIRMYKKYHKDTNAVSDGYVFIINAYDGLDKALFDMDAEDYTSNFFDRMTNADAKEFEKADTQRKAYAHERAIKILDEFNSRFDVEAVLKYAENSDPAGSKCFTCRNAFFDRYNKMKEWAGR